MTRFVKLILFLSLTVFITACGTGNIVKQNHEVNKKDHLATYKISSLERFGKSSAFFHICLQGKQEETCSGVSEEDVKLLMKHFKKESSSDLIGQELPTTQGWPLNAVEDVMVVEKYGPNYKAPSNQIIYDRLAESLASLKCPDYSQDIDGRDVAKAYSDAWDFFTAKKEWLAKIKQAVYKKSNGIVSLLNADVETFNNRYRGEAEYLILVRQNGSDTQQQSVRVILGPYKNPCKIDE